MLTEKTEIGQIEVTASNHVQVRTDTIIERDGEEVSRSFHRHVVSPGDDYANEDAKVKAICKTVHTAAAVKAYKDSIQVD